LSDQPYKQGVDVLGPGLDIRSNGGFILGPGSQIDGKPYRQIDGHGHMVQCPDWLVRRLGTSPVRTGVSSAPLVGINPDRARDRAL